MENKESSDIKKHVNATMIGELENDGKLDEIYEMHNKMINELSKAYYSELKAKIIKAFNSKGFVFDSNEQFESFLASRCNIVNHGDFSILKVGHNPICTFGNLMSKNISKNGITLYFKEA